MSGAQYPLKQGETLDQMLTRLKPMFFDVTFEPAVTTKTPFVLTVSLDFADDRLKMDTTWNVSFGAARRGPLVGERK